MSLKQFSANLRKLPKLLGARVAEAAAPKLTDLAKTTFAAGQDPYGVDWIPGTHGNDVTLRKTGTLERYVRYVAIGTKLRVSLGVPYAKYQIGRRAVFPTQTQGSALPLGYAKAIDVDVKAAVAELLGGAS